VNFGANPTTSIGLRSFRTKNAAQLQRLADEVRAGKKFSAATLETLAQVVEHMARAGDALAAAHPMLSDLIAAEQAPDPTQEQNAESDQAVETALAHLAALRMKEQEALAKRRLAA
jgi:hypothetical protein